MFVRSVGVKVLGAGALTPRRGAVTGVGVAGHQGNVSGFSLRFAPIYRRYFGFVWTNLLRLGVPRASVEDAVQDVFVVVHRRSDTFEGRAAVRTWLFAITRRVASDYRRQQRRAQRKQAAIRAANSAPLGTTDAVERQELAWQLVSALHELDEDKRVAVTLHTLEEMSGPEVAQMLGLNVDTAYSRIKAGRRQLRRALARHGVRSTADLLDSARDVTRPRRSDRSRVAAALTVKLGLAGGAHKAVVLGSFGVVIKSVGIASAIAAGVLVTVTPPTTRPNRDATTARAVATHGTPGSDRVDAPSVTATVEPRATRQPQPAPLQRARSSGEHRGGEPVSVDADEPRSPQRSPTLRLRRRTPAQPEAVTPSPADLVALEVRALADARAALRKGQAGAALLALRGFAHGGLTPLAPERAAYEVVALCELGQHGAARRALDSAPALAGPLRERVHRACDAPEQQTTPPGRVARDRFAVAGPPSKP